MTRDDNNVKILGFPCLQHGSRKFAIRWPEGEGNLSAIHIVPTFLTIADLICSDATSFVPKLDIGAQPHPLQHMFRRVAKSWCHHYDVSRHTVLAPDDQQRSENFHHRWMLYDRIMAHKAWMIQGSTVTLIEFRWPRLWHPSYVTTPDSTIFLGTGSGNWE